MKKHKKNPGTGVEFKKGPDGTLQATVTDPRIKAGIRSHPWFGKRLIEKP